MQEILAIALSSMQQDATRLERIGMNLANTMTPGYKRSVVSVTPGFAQQVDTAWSAVHTSANDLQLHDDARPGTLKSTGQALDLALAGPGYFEVQTPEGLLYTRRGEFRVDGLGRLVTAQGHPVMGAGGEIHVSNASPRIDSLGQVFDSGTADRDPAAVSRLKLVGFDDARALQHVGEGLMSAQDASAGMRELNEPIVKQGYLENSNVNSMHEMVQLIQTMRHFESMQRVAVGYDEMVGSAIRKLGELS
jgi:flagellar basal-body rod protein FlgF